MHFENLQEWLSWIESCHPNEIDLGLERMGQVFQRLNCNFTQTKIITVAGTNGKGSCVTVLEQLLSQSGLKVGSYTSPHFLRYNERIKLNGNEIADQPLIESFEKIEQLRADISLTYFEYGTLAALDIFSNLALDVIIMEVGLGGRLDASNIVDADIAIVTNIDIDHEAWLGSDVEIIGREKSGIFRKDKIALCGDPQPPLSVKQTADNLGAVFYQRDKDFSVQVNANDWVWQGLSAEQQELCIADLPKVNLPIDSVVVAIQAYEFLNLNIDRQLYHRLDQVQLTGRYQKLSYHGKALILDVAHNPAAAEHLALRLKQERLADSHNVGALHALVAMMADKDINAILAPLVPVVDAWYVADLKSNPRALSAQAMQAHLHQFNVQSLTQKSCIVDALESALASMDDHDSLIVFGSFFTVSEVLAFIQASQPLNNKQVGST